MKLGKKVLELRKKNGLSQEELGNLIGVTRQTISNWELDDTNPNPNQLKQLSKIFNVSIDSLLDNDINNIKESNTEKLAGIVIKIIKIFYIIIPICILIILLLFLLFRVNKNSKKVEVDTTIVTESIYCKLYGEEHGYTIEYYQNNDIIVSMYGDNYFMNILDLGKYEYAHQIFNVINDYVKKNSGECNMIKDKELNDIVNMYIKDGTLTNTSATIVIEDKNPNRIVYGSDFYIEKYDGTTNSWSILETTGENYAFNAMAYYVDSNGLLEMKQDWTHIYGELPKGIYRIVKNVFFESDIPVDDNDKFYVWVEFEI